MNGFLRVLPYLWPYRRKLFLSVIFGALVALFWGLNLSVAFPIVKVLLEKQKLGDYVNAEIDVIQADIDECNSMLASFDDDWASLEAAGRADDGAKVRISKKRARELSKLTTASRKLLVLNWLKSYIIPRLPRDQFDTLALILAGLLVATLIKGICIFVQDVLIGSVVELTVMSIRKECFRRTLKLDLQTMANNGTSQLMCRFTNDMSVLSNGLLLLGGKVIREPLKAAVCLVLAFLFCWQLTLLSLLFAPLAMLIFYRIGKTLKQASHRLLESMSNLYKTLEETFDASKVVIAFQGARGHRRRFHRENKEYLAKALKIVRIDALTSPTSEMLGMLAAFIAVLPGAYLVLRGTTSIWGIRLLPGNPWLLAELALFYALLAGAIDPARKLSKVYAKLKRSSAAADRVFSLIDCKSLVKQSATPKPLPRHSKSIEFRKVEFAYVGNGSEDSIRAPVLEDVSLKIDAGEVVAIVGDNGSGKSTLVNLLPRFFDPDRGAVLIDGIDIRDARLCDLRSQIGVVTQETLLFDETIYENIRYGKPDATAKQIEAAARQAHATQFVEQLPDGFETRIGEKGQRLSGGQRQRVALARAILRDPAILILDEATSAIDAQSELLIHQALRNFVAGRTTFLITHSVSQSCLDFVSRIVVMDQGRLIAAGPHAELVESCPAYRNLVRVQAQQKSA